MSPPRIGDRPACRGTSPGVPGMPRRNGPRGRPSGRRPSGRTGPGRGTCRPRVHRRCRGSRPRTGKSPARRRDWRARRWHGTEIPMPDRSSLPPAVRASGRRGGSRPIRAGARGSVAVDQEHVEAIDDRDDVGGLIIGRVGVVIVDNPARSSWSSGDGDGCLESHGDLAAGGHGADGPGRARDPAVDQELDAAVEWAAAGVVQGRRHRERLARREERAGQGERAERPVGLVAVRGPAGTAKLRAVSRGGNRSRPCRSRRRSHRGDSSGRQASRWPSVRRRTSHPDCGLRSRIRNESASASARSLDPRPGSIRASEFARISPSDVGGSTSGRRGPPRGARRRRGPARGPGRNAGPRKSPSPGSRSHLASVPCCSSRRGRGWSCGRDRDRHGSDFPERPPRIPPAPRPSVQRGRAIASAGTPTTAIRVRRRSHSETWGRRRAGTPGSASRNIVAPQSTTSRRRRFQRWIRSGTARPSRHQSSAGLRKPRLTGQPPDDGLCLLGPGEREARYSMSVRSAGSVGRGLVVVGSHPAERFAEVAAEGPEPLEIGRPDGIGMAPRRDPPEGRSRSRKETGRRNGNSSSSGARVWRKSTSWWRCRRCRSARISESSGSKPSERMITSPRRLVRSASVVEDAAERGLAAGLGPPPARRRGPRSGPAPIGAGSSSRDRRPIGGDQADRVALADHQVSQRRGQPPRVLELGAARVPAYPMLADVSTTR